MNYQQDELRRIYDTLTKDLVSILGKSKKLSQTKRRSFIRALVSLIEFDTYNRKQRALQLHSSNIVHFNIAEMILLNEIQPEVDNKGEIKVKQKFIRLIDNYKFAIKLFCKASQISFVLPTNSPGWVAFKDTIEMRNRISHPKNENDIIITDHNFRTVLSAYEWFMNNYKMIIELLQNNS